jgi:hypothetical protein
VSAPASGSGPLPARARAGRRRSGRLLAAVLAGAMLAGACGKKGPPMAPLLRLPAQVTDLRVHRAGDEVLLRFTVPSANVEGERPADLARVEVYAVTAVRPPVLADADEGDLRNIATLVASAPVLPPLPRDAEGRPAMPGLQQGGDAILQERLGPEARTPVTLRGDVRTGAAADRPVARAIIAPDGDGLRRYYFAVGINHSGRPGPPSILVEAPLGAVSSPPSAPAVAYTATTLSLSWTPPADARVAPRSEEGLLPSRPLTPRPPETRYNVYRASSAGAVLAPAVPLNPEPLATPAFEEPGVQFGVERCFVVRPVDVLAGIDVEGSASPPGCVTPRDTFPPATPASLAAVASAGAISLIWEPVGDADLAGYLVLRGEAREDGTDAPLETITPAPIRENTFRDATVRPGVRYVYAVSAVDTATPPNTSPLSNRVEETARE